MKVGIVGLGLIGGSLARAYAQAGDTVYACDLDADMLAFAQLAGVVTQPLTDQLVSQCELVLLAVYPRVCVQWLTEKAPLIAPGTLVLDCCGVKRRVVEGCFPLAREYGFVFVGGHPMAGTQFSGFKYSRADLFRGQPMVLVPPAFDDLPLLQRVKEALAPCDFGHFSVTTAADHDRMIAFTSQMPHILSNAFIKSPTALEHKGFSAGSYRDLTRVAWLNAPMWAELFLENRESVIKELDGYLDALTQYRDAIRDGDCPTLTRLLEEGKQRKEAVDG